MADTNPSDSDSVSDSDSDSDSDSFANELEEALEEMDDEKKDALRRVTEILKVPKESFNTLIRSCKLLKNATKTNIFFTEIEEATTEAEKDAARKRLDEKIIQEALQNGFKAYGKKPDMKKCDCKVEHGDYIVNNQEKLVCKRCGVVGNKKKKRSKTKRSKDKVRHSTIRSKAKAKRSKAKRSKAKRSKAKARRSEAIRSKTKARRSKARRLRKTKGSRRSKRST